MTEAQRRWWRLYREWRIAKRTAAETGFAADQLAEEDAAQRLEDAGEPPHECADDCDEVH